MFKSFRGVLPKPPKKKAQGSVRILIEDQNVYSHQEIAHFVILIKKLKLW